MANLKGCLLALRGNDPKSHPDTRNEGEFVPKTPVNSVGTSNPRVPCPRQKEMARTQLGG